MTIPGYTTAQIDAIVNEPKVIRTNLAWRRVGGGFKLDTTVAVPSIGAALRLTGRLTRKYSFCLLLQNTPIRRWCTGMSHTNPDGESIPAPHLHRYDEVHGDKWAYPLAGVTSVDVNAGFQAFLYECNIQHTGDYQAVEI